MYELNIFCRGRHDYHEPLDTASLQCLTRKNFADETKKKMAWVVNMFTDWREYRNGLEGLSDIHCDLNDVTMINEESLKFAMCRILTEVKKVDGSDFPPKTMYDIVMCIQFHLEKLGFGWKLISEEIFQEVRFTLDNIMKERTAKGIGISVHKSDVLTLTDEDTLWCLGLLGTHSPEVLLHTVMFTIGLSCSLRAGKEQYCLRSVPFKSQFTFLYDDEGKLYFHYVEDIGLKTNKGGLKHRKTEPKEVTS